jgi:hypothetical protein
MSPSFSLTHLHKGNAMKIFPILSVLGAVSLAFVASACGGSTIEDDSARSIPVDGLSVVEMDEAAGKLVVKFENGGHTLTYDMRVGPKMLTPPSAEDLTANPELLTYEVDAQVLDANGQPFLMQMGGDSFIDASWRMPHVENFNEARRLVDIQLMRDAVPAFRKLKLPASLDQLRLTGVQIGLGVEAVPEKPDLAALTPTEKPTPDQDKIGPPGGALSPQGVLESGGSSVVKWDFIVRKRDIKVLGIKVGDHSAVHLRGWSSSSVVFNAYSCNHGTCASDTGAMNTHCVMSGFRNDDGTHSRFFYNERSTSQGQTPGGCSTPYGWSSGGGHHNCNDDSELQAKSAFHDASQSTTAGSCGTSGFHNFAPGCSY